MARNWCGLSGMVVVGRRSSDGSHWMAEREGFEPSVRIFSLRRFSKPLPSATRPPLHDQLLWVSVRRRAESSAESLR